MLQTQNTYWAASNIVITDMRVIAISVLTEKGIPALAMGIHSIGLGLTLSTYVGTSATIALDGSVIPESVVP